MGVKCLQNVCLFSIEYHTTELKKVCRVCGKRVQKAKGRERSYLVTEKTEDLSEVFRIDVSNDSEDTHPPSFCHSCWTFMHFWHTRGTNAPSVGRVFTWIGHSEPECTVRNFTLLNDRLKHYTIRSANILTTSTKDEAKHVSEAGRRRTHPKTSHLHSLPWHQLLSSLRNMAQSLAHTQTQTCYVLYALTHWTAQLCWGVGTWSAYCAAQSGFRSLGMRTVHAVTALSKITPTLPPDLPWQS